MADSILNSSSFHEGLRSGLDDAYVILWREGFKLLVACYFALGFTDEAEDLWSETFIKLYQTNCSTFDPQKGRFQSWLFTVGRRAAYDLMRKRRRRDEVPLDSCLDSQLTDIGPDKKEGGSLELRTLARRAKASLSENDRIILSLRVEEGLPFELIAEKLGISASTAAKRASRALKRLWIAFERLSPSELPRRIRRPKRRHPPRAIPKTYKEQRQGTHVR